MIDNFDYNKYDKITVTTKTACSQKVIDDYQRFGWEWIKKDNDRIFSNIVHLTFKRAHRLKNKDKLQYLQVCYEEKLNAVFDLERSRNLFSSVLFIVFALFLSAFLALGVNFITQGKFLFGWGCVLLGVATVCFIPVLIKIRVRENRKYQERVNALNQEIKEMLEGVTELSEDKDEN